MAVAAAIADWAAAGATPAQLATLMATTYTVSDLAGAEVGASSPGHVTIDANAAGYGWYVDATPQSTFEFGNAVGGSELAANPTQAPAGHIDLLTVVAHEMGHQLGLDDNANTNASHDVMYTYLAPGERRLPVAADVAQANASNGTAKTDTQAVPINLGDGSGGGVKLTGTSDKDAIGGTHTADFFGGAGGHDMLTGNSGGDHFAFDQVALTSATNAALHVDHVMDYSAAHGDTLDFTSLFAATVNPSAQAANLVHVTEEANGTAASVSVNVAGPNAAAHWVEIAHLDGVHAGQTVDVALDAANPHQVSHLHVDGLVHA